MNRNLAGAHFPVIKRIEGFVFQGCRASASSKYRIFLSFTWIDRNENLLFFWPAGTGKNSPVDRPGIGGNSKGYTVCFERITSLVKLLKTMDVQRSSTFRINRIMKSDVSHH
jgi:DNA replication protein DnaC